MLQLHFCLLTVAFLKLLAWQQSAVELLELAVSKVGQEQGTEWWCCSAPRPGWLHANLVSWLLLPELILSAKTLSHAM